MELEFAHYAAIARDLKDHGQEELALHLLLAYSEYREVPRAQAALMMPTSEAVEVVHTSPQPKKKRRRKDSEVFLRILVFFAANYGNWYGAKVTAESLDMIVTNMYRPLRTAVDRGYLCSAGKPEKWSATDSLMNELPLIMNQLERFTQNTSQTSSTPCAIEV